MNGVHLSFKIHHSSDAISSYERRKEIGTKGSNIMIGEDSISLFVGDLSKQKPEWRVNGKTFFEEEGRYNPLGKWKPIIYPYDTNIIWQEIRQKTDDEKIQKLLFYIKTTGHKAIEFVLKSDKEIPRSIIFRFTKLKSLGLPFMDIYHLRGHKYKSFIYDCCIYLKTDSVSEIAKSLKLIEKLLNSLIKRKIKHRSALKYALIRRPKLSPESNGLFSITIKMNDPRDTMVASDLRIFPTKDWRIKEEWLNN